MSSPRAGGHFRATPRPHFCRAFSGTVRELVTEIPESAATPGPDHPALFGEGPRGEIPVGQGRAQRTQEPSTGDRIGQRRPPAADPQLSSPRAERTRGRLCGPSPAPQPVLILGAGWWIGRGSGDETGKARNISQGANSAAHQSTTPSVAVLPFENMSADPENEYFTDGLTEELISALAKVEGLQIPARTTVFRLKGTDLDVQEVGKRLGVDNVLEGSVRKSGNRLRITAQLVKVEDGFNLWSETYDRELEDVFAIQDEIASNIVGALQLTLSPRYQRAMRPVECRHPRLRFLSQGARILPTSQPADLEAALEMFTQAIDIDSSFAPAWAGLADCYTDIFRNYDSTYGNIEAADRASQRRLISAPISPRLTRPGGMRLGNASSTTRPS